MLLWLCSVGWPSVAEWAAFLLRFWSAVLPLPPSLQVGWSHQLNATPESGWQLHSWSPAPGAARQVGFVTRHR